MNLPWNGSELAEQGEESGPVCVCMTDVSKSTVKMFRKFTLVT